MTEETKHPAKSAAQWTTLSGQECNILRGIAIMGIMLHNYCHWLSPIVKENEFTYKVQNVRWFAELMKKPLGEVEHLFFHLFSYFGHYGVPIFLFLSAYGLVRKYENTPSVDEQESTYDCIAFLKYHWLKLFRMMIFGFAAFVLLDTITPAPHRYQVIDIIAQMGLVNNLLPTPDKVIWPGPYWFFGLMLQLYVAYRFVLYRKDWKWIVGAMLLCTIMQSVVAPESEELNYIRYNFIGGIAPFGLGLLYAKYGKALSKKYYCFLMIPAFCFVIFADASFLTWLLNPLFVCVAFISLTKVAQLLPTGTALWFTWLSSLLNWIGTVSAAIFVCHPITRKIIIPISREGDYWAGLILYVITTMCLAWCFHQFMKHLPSPKMK